VDPLGLASAEDGAASNAGRPFRFRQPSDVADDWTMQSNPLWSRIELLKDPETGEPLLMSSVGCKVVSGAKVVASCTGNDSFTPQTMADYTEDGLLSRYAIGEALEDAAPDGMVVEVDHWEKQLTVEKLLEVAALEPAPLVIGRAKMNGADHFILILGGTVNSDQTDVTFDVDGSSKNDDNRVYMLNTEDQENSVFQVDRIETFRYIPE